MMNFGIYILIGILVNFTGIRFLSRKIEDFEFWYVMDSIPGALAASFFILLFILLWPLTFVLYVISAALFWIRGDIEP